MDTRMTVPPGFRPHMPEYPKIQSIYKRDPNNHYKTFTSEYSTPEIGYLAGCEWEFTEKVDGTNIRVGWDGEGTVEYGGRTNRASIPTFLFSYLADTFGHGQFDQYDFPMTLYGEGFGARIQKGGGNYIPGGVGFILFDVLVDGWWLRSDDVAEVGENLSVRVVPVLDTGTLRYACELAATGFKSWVAKDPETVAEGLVCRPLVQMFDRRRNRIVTKVKHKDFTHE